MSDNISLTTKQIAFITEMLEIKSPEAAVEAFMSMMIEIGVDPSRIDYVITKIMKNMEKNK